MNVSKMADPAIRTACPYCGIGCGVIATQQPDGSVSIKGDPDHPANFGRLCSKGSALAETIGLADRLLYPEVEGRRADWGETLDLVAETFSTAIAEHGPDSVAFYVSGQLLTEDYYVANKLMKGFIGSANIDTNSRLCMASSVAGHRRAFGSDTVPGTYEDLELANLVVLTGSNLAWCHPVLYQRLAAAKERRPEMKIVLIDPRRTMTADIADIHLAIAPDGDLALFNGLLVHLTENGALDENFIARHTNGFPEALELARSQSPDEIGALTGLPMDPVEEFYRLFTQTPKVVTVYSQGVNQSSVGTDKVNAIINCHLATGRIGKPGMGPFSITGQPNAMGGREVGGLANMLAAHMDIENPIHRERVRRFWHAPVIATTTGLKAVDMFRAVADGSIKALWIMATNPVDSLPEGDLVEEALRNCPFVVVSDVVSETDTLRHAHVKLPATAWGEKDGTVTNSERRISRQRPFLGSPGDAKPDWWIIAEVAKRMGYGPAFSYTCPSEIFAEHAALSALENHRTRDFDIGAYADIEAADYETLSPFQWPAFAGSTRQTTGKDMRFFGEGEFFTPDHKARFVAVSASAPRRTSDAFPLVLNTGRVRDHWHTMTRTGKSPRLSQHIAEPFIELHPADAASCGIAGADLVRVTSETGSILARALLTPRQRKGSVFIPMHWTDQFAANGRVDRLVPSLIDPTSGQPASKHVPVRLERFDAKAYGFAVLTSKPAHIEADYWAIARCRDGWRVELAFANEAADWNALAEAILPRAPEVETLSFDDNAAKRWRFARFAGERLIGALYLAAEPVAVPRDWVVEQMAVAHEVRRERISIIAGRPSDNTADKGPIVCSCFAVGAKQICDAIAGGCRTVDAVGKALQAGTNCGSCRAEIRGIINAYPAPKETERAERPSPQTV